MPLRSRLHSPHCFTGFLYQPASWGGKPLQVFEPEDGLLRFIRDQGMAMGRPVIVFQIGVDHHLAFLLLVQYKLGDAAIGCRGQMS
jgi:hypothetical protein